MKPFAPLLLAAALLAAAAPMAASAQVGVPRPIPAGAQVAQVSLRYGPALASMASHYGAREVDDLAAILKRDIELAAPKGGFTRVDLVLEDARPTRPTIEQQSRLIGLSSQSKALGGAIISGAAFRADGSSEPLTYSWFETNLADSFGGTTWYDAERAFDFLASELSRGKVSKRLGPSTPGRYSCRGAFDVWCTGL